MSITWSLTNGAKRLASVGFPLGKPDITTKGLFLPIEDGTPRRIMGVPYLKIWPMLPKSCYSEVINAIAIPGLSAIRKLARNGLVVIDHPSFQSGTKLLIPDKS